MLLVFAGGLLGMMAAESSLGEALMVVGAALLGYGWLWCAVWLIAG